MIDPNHSRNLALLRRAGCFRIPLLLTVLIASLGLIILAGRGTAQTFATLYNFKPLVFLGDPLLTGRPGATNVGGAEPLAGLMLSGTTLYGAAHVGGSLGGGTIFSVKTDGTGFTTLHEFEERLRDSNGDPQGTLTSSNDTLYGTGADGFVFALNSDGKGFTNLHAFHDGSSPVAGLILLGDTLYGTTYWSGNSPNGTIFAVKIDGTAFTTLHSFTALTPSYTNTFGGVISTNRDGAYPGGLVISGNTLYGAANEGGSWGGGTVFAINTDGSDITILHSFSVGSPDSSGFYTNGEGIGPVGSLILSHKTLYGMAAGGGNSLNGTIFAVNTDGTGFRTLHDFTELTPHYTNYINGVANVVYTNHDGAEPTTGLVLSGDTLFGTTVSGGDFGNGAVFAVKSDGTGFTTLHSFTTSYTNSDGTYTNSDGVQPVGGLFFSGHTLYGTTTSGGSSGNGTIFSISFPATTLPQLTIIPSERNIVLVWPTNFTGFTLQSTTNLGLSAIWATNLPAPVVVNGRNTVINTISSARQFFRLSQ